MPNFLLKAFVIFLIIAQISQHSVDVSDYEFSILMCKIQSFYNLVKYLIDTFCLKYCQLFALDTV